MTLQFVAPQPDGTLILGLGLSFANLDLIEGDDPVVVHLADHGGEGMMVLIAAVIAFIAHGLEQERAREKEVRDAARARLVQKQAATNTRRIERLLKAREALLAPRLSHQKCSVALRPPAP